MVDRYVPRCKGHYILLCHLDTTRCIRVGRLGDVLFSEGFFGYVGSALEGLEGRLRRHLGPPPGKLRWHIDYLLAHARPLGAVCGTVHQARECPLAEHLARRFPRIKGFGSTDCRCAGHLFHAQSYDELLATAQEAFRRLGCDPRRVDQNQ